jgi:predicted nuclease with TOPRIM domain
VSDQITPTDISRLASNESIISAVLKWAAANGRRLSKADLERMGQGVDAMVEENERLTKERDEEIGCADHLDVYCNSLEVGIRRLTEQRDAAREDASKFHDEAAELQDRIKRLEEAGNRAIENSYYPDRVKVWNEAKEAKP